MPTFDAVGKILGRVDPEIECVVPPLPPNVQVIKPEPNAKSGLGRPGSTVNIRRVGEITQINAAIDHKAKAVQIVDAFSKRSIGAFTKIRRGEVAQGTRDRIRRPSLIQQGDTPLCGPASMLYVMATETPEDYASFVTELYDHGYAKLGSLDIHPRPDVLDSTPGPNENAADWISLVSIRDSKNFLLPYTKSGKANWIPRIETLEKYLGLYVEQTPGMTLPIEVAKWLNEAGYQSVVHKGQGKSNFKDEDSVIDEINLCFNGKCHVILVIAAQLIKGGADLDSIYADHWVVLKSKIVQDSSLDKNVTFSVFTWGDDSYSVPQPGSKPIPTAHFLKNFYGYISCTDYIGNRPVMKSTVGDGK